MSITKIKHTNVSKRPHPATIAYLLHRVSGLVLVLFLPIHLLIIGQALGAGMAADNGVNWSSGTLAKLSVALLIGLLTMHMIGGIRILCIEYFCLVGSQHRWLVAMLTLSTLTSGLLLIAIIM